MALVLFTKDDIVGQEQKTLDIFDDDLSKEFGDFKRTDGVIFTPSRELITTHYAHLEKLYPAIYQSAINNLSRNTICARLYQPIDGQEKLIEILANSMKYVLGPTDPADLSKGLRLRQRLSKDIMEKAKEEGRAVRNVAHASGNAKEGEIEEARFRPYMGEIRFVPYSQQPHLQIRLSDQPF